MNLHGYFFKNPLKTHIIEASLHFSQEGKMIAQGFVFTEICSCNFCIYAIRGENRDFLNEWNKMCIAEFRKFPVDSKYKRGLSFAVRNVAKLSGHYQRCQIQ